MLYTLQCCRLKESSYFHGHVMAIFSEPVILVIFVVFEIKNNGKRIKRILLKVTVVTLFAKFDLKLPPLS